MRLWLSVTVQRRPDAGNDRIRLCDLSLGFLDRRVAVYDGFANRRQYSPRLIDVPPHQPHQVIGWQLILKHAGLDASSRAPARIIRDENLSIALQRDLEV
jgi:hypothetical protein